MSIVARISVTVLLLAFIYYNLDYNTTTNKTNHTDLEIVNQTNTTCEECHVLGDHIEVKCFGENLFYENSTCKIYYEICVQVACTSNTSHIDPNDYLIHFNGQTIRVPRMHILFLALCIIYLALPFQQIRAAIAY